MQSCTYVRTYTCIVQGRAGRLAACARAFHVRAAVCKLRTFAFVSCALEHVLAPHIRARLPSRYVVRAAGETPPKLTVSASSATRLRQDARFSARPRTAQSRVERPRSFMQKMQRRVQKSYSYAIPWGGVQKRRADVTKAVLLGVTVINRIVSNHYR